QRHTALHEPRAGQRRAAHRALRRLLAGGSLLRARYRQAALPVRRAPAPDLPPRQGAAPSAPRALPHALARPRGGDPEDAGEGSPTALRQRPGGPRQPPGMPARREAVVVDPPLRGPDPADGSEDPRPGA